MASEPTEKEGRDERVAAAAAAGETRHAEAERGAPGPAVRRDPRAREAGARGPSVDGDRAGERRAVRRDRAVDRAPAAADGVALGWDGARERAARGGPRGDAGGWIARVARRAEPG